jgi:hypothetical protein
MRYFTRTFTSAAVLVVLAYVAFPEDGRAAGPLEGSSGTAPMMSDAMPGHSQIPGMMQYPGHATGGMEAQQDGGTIPTLPGQDAFGAIQEIVRILEADPKTDWAKVKLEALRQHLIDMNEVTLRADASPKQVDGGLEIAITGDGRTLVAIRRMIPEWAKMANGLNGWTATVASLPNGELLTVATTTPKEVQHIRGLGFIGLLASGSWHQPHHLAMARGEFPYLHGTH